MQREHFLREQRLVHDEQAKASVRELVDEAMARQVVPFLCSPAGNALAAAETMTLGLAWYQGDAFPKHAAQHYGDRTQVGATAVLARLDALRLAMANGQSASPASTAMLVGGCQLTPEDADAVAAFFATDVGKKWCELECAAFVRTQERFMAFLELTRARGFLRYLGDSEPLVLPAAKYRDGSL